VLTASGKADRVRGFRRAYVEGSDDPVAELEEQEAILPQCSVGDQIDRDGTAIVLLAPSRRSTRRRRRADSPRRRSSRNWSGSASAAVHVRADDRNHRPRGYVFRQGKALVPASRRSP
jgi:DNA topoisomerase-1